MIRRPPRSTLTDPLFPYTALFRSLLADCLGGQLGNFRVPGNDGASSSDHHFGVVSAFGLIDVESRVLRECPYLFEKFRSLRHKNKCRSEEHTSELQSLMRNSYAVFCLKKHIKNNHNHHTQIR